MFKVIINSLRAIRLTAVPVRIPHALAVVLGFAAFFAWLFAYPPLHGGYLAESDLYEFFLPTFLSPVTTWSSYEFGGMPSFADPSDTTVYPLHLLARLAGSWFALIACAYVVAACGMYAYVYSLTRSKTGALFSALAYSLSEAMLERIAHLGVVQTMGWFPWIALAIDRIREAHPWRWMAPGALMIGCCFLAGNPQTFLYAGYLFAAYALCGARADRAGSPVIAATLSMGILGALLTSIKTVPLVEASLYTSRQTSNFEAFVSHGNTPTQMLSILFPTILHEGREAPTYVGMATLVFAVAALRSTFLNWRVMFWLVTVSLMLLIGVGDATPFPRLLYLIPFYAKFRVIARHLIFAAFGLSVLAGFGVAGVSSGTISRRALVTAVLIVLVAVTLAAASLAWTPTSFEYEYANEAPRAWAFIWNNRIWLQFGVVLTALTASSLFALTRLRLAPILLLAVLCADLVNATPYQLTWSGLLQPMIAASAVQPSVHAIALARSMAPLRQRLLSPAGTQIDAVVPALFARLWRIPIAGGYGPMLLQRYSDLALMGTNGSVRPAVMAFDDAALDLMAVRYIAVQRDVMENFETATHNNAVWAANDLDIPVGRPDCAHEYARSTSIPLPRDVTTVALALVTHLRCDETLPQGAEVLRLRLMDGGAVVHERTLRAGVDTAETGLSDALTAKRVQHQVPSNVFRDPSTPSALRFLTRITLPRGVRGGRLELDAPATYGWITVDHLTLIDETGANHPLGAPTLWLSDSRRWRQVSQFETSRVSDRGADDKIRGETPYVVLENLRALPRAWIVSTTRTLSDADTLETIRRSQLPDGARFVPAEIALISADDGVHAADIFETGTSAATVEEMSDSRIVVNAATTGGGFLILSEAFYPGWHGWIDDTETHIYRTDSAFQGVVLPPGRHYVRFEFRSQTLAAGRVLSFCALLCVAVVLWRARVRSPVPGAASR
jgi:hypothetical protein